MNAFDSGSHGFETGGLALAPDEAFGAGGHDFTPFADNAAVRADVDGAAVESSA